MNGDTETPATWNERGLVAAGFESAHRIADLDLAQVPREAGVYVVLRWRSEDAVAFLAVGSAGRFRDRDPNVDIEQLEAAWVDGADVLYVGKGDDLRQRIGLLQRFGAGEPVAHWGGRYVWQLEGAAELRVAWRTTDPAFNVSLRASLVDAFIAEHDRRPFGNRLAPTCSARSVADANERT